MSLKPQTIYFNVITGSLSAYIDSIGRYTKKVLAEDDSLMLIGFHNKKDLKLRGNFESVFNYYIETDPEVIYLWGLMIDVNTGNLYLSQSELGNKIPFINLVDVLNKLLRGHGKITVESLISAIQKYKLTLQIEDLYNTMILQNTLQSASSLIGTYITAKDRKDKGVGGFPYTVFIAYLLHVFEGVWEIVNGLFLDISNSLPEMAVIEEISSSRKSSLSSRMFFKMCEDIGRMDRRLGVSTATVSTFEQYTGLDPTEDRMKEMQAYGMDLGMISNKTTGLMEFGQNALLSFGDVRYYNTLELLNTVKEGNEIIYSSDISKMLTEKGFDKFLSPGQLKEVTESSDRIRYHMIEGGMVDASLETIDSFYSRIITNSLELERGLKDPIGLVLKLYTKTVKYMEEVS